MEVRYRYISEENIVSNLPGNPESMSEKGARRPKSERVGLAVGVGFLLLGVVRLDTIDNASACARELSPTPSTFSVETFPIPCTQFADDFRVEGGTSPQDDTFPFPNREQFEQRFVKTS